MIEASSMKRKIVFFPGKNTALKRYVPYFPMFELIKPEDDPNPKCILVHSLGLYDAVTYYANSVIKPVIISMDGVKLDSVAEDTTIISFRPEHKIDNYDNGSKVIYYKVKPELSHYPYMDKRVRDIIVQEINNY